MNEIVRPESASGLVVAEVETEPAVKKPSMYLVLILNDDFTPMDFVVVVIMEFFGKTREMANQIMLKVHFEGRGICGVYTREIAETKVAQVNAYARSHEHPLLCMMQVT